jgi:hypothetical protein
MYTVFLMRILYFFMRLLFYIFICVYSIKCMLSVLILMELILPPTNIVTSDSKNQFMDSLQIYNFQEQNMLDLTLRWFRSET